MTSDAGATTVIAEYSDDRYTAVSRVINYSITPCCRRDHSSHYSVLRPGSDNRDAFAPMADSYRTAMGSRCFAVLPVRSHEGNSDDQEVVP